MPSFVTHLESAIDGTRLPHDRIQTMHKDRPLWVRYDLDAVCRAVDPRKIAARPPTLWRYRELLPLADGAEAVTLGEGMSPLLPAPRLGKTLGLSSLWVKDESQLPTGSFKSRGLSMAVTMPNTSAAKKRVRADRKLHQQNVQRKSELKTLIRKFESLVKAKRPDEARKTFTLLNKRLDQARSKGLLHRNTASRRKSTFARALTKLSAS